MMAVGMMVIGMMATGMMMVPDRIDPVQTFRYTIRLRVIGYQHFGTSNNTHNCSERVVHSQEPANRGRNHRMRKRK
ncbi:hypothetical protein PF005_g31762 [Phytophthora fragariae]|uniref:Secreted protein n=1 Tax=Phytophthora fragariae TaxID=53985 RepID=A0A6A3V7N4_9STRA|nr:hypothetical protein PF005_g31762 [Phytophthora fragariae]